MYNLRYTQKYSRSALAEKSARLSRRKTYVRIIRAAYLSDPLCRVISGL